MFDKNLGDNNKKRLRNVYKIKIFLKHKEVSQLDKEKQTVFKL